MTTKDYVYLGLILLTALAFYCNGFYSGVCRSKRVYETLLDDAEQDTVPINMTANGGKSFAQSEKEFDFVPAHHRRNPAFPRKELRGDFGSN